METPAVGFIGFGEAGSTIASGLRSAGVTRLFGFDIATGTADRGPIIRQRAADSGTTLVATGAELAQVSDLVLSTVTASSALDAAVQMVPFLERRHTYADLNSVSPGVKREIDARIAASLARFVEAAVMAPVLPYGHRVPMLLGGPGAAAFAATVAPLGMRVEVLPGPVGTAAAVKMCRSIVVKGLEAILCECVLGASRYQAEELVFASLQESYPALDWKQLASHATNRLVVHGARRAREMEEVAATLRAGGVEPIMAEATARRQDWSAQMNLRQHFGPEGPKTYREMLDALAASDVGLDASRPGGA